VGKRTTLAESLEDRHAIENETGGFVLRGLSRGEVEYAYLADDGTELDAERFWELADATSWNPESLYDNLDNWPVRRDLQIALRDGSYVERGAPDSEYLVSLWERHFPPRRTGRAAPEGTTLWDTEDGSEPRPGYNADECLWYGDDGEPL
jgi:hypothetical protein